MILASDSNRARLSKLAPRAERAGAAIETRLLNPPNELQELSSWRGHADLVLVDAPCSGSGTWRRNPEGRWRLTPGRLERLVARYVRRTNLRRARNASTPSIPPQAKASPDGSGTGVYI